MQTAPPAKAFNFLVKSEAEVVHVEAKPEAEALHLQTKYQAEATHFQVNIFDVQPHVKAEALTFQA